MVLEPQIFLDSYKNKTKRSTNLMWQCKASSPRDVVIHIIFFICVCLISLDFTLFSNSIIALIYQTSPIYVQDFLQNLKVINLQNTKTQRSSSFRKRKCERDKKMDIPKFSLSHICYSSKIFFIFVGFI